MLRTFHDGQEQRSRDLRMLQMAFGLTNSKMAFGLTNSKMAFGPTWFCFLKILISYSRSRAETVFFHTIFSRRIHWCGWEPVKTPHLKKLMKSENANGPKNQPCKNGFKTCNLGWNGFRKFNLGHADLDMAPNFHPDPLVIVPDPKKRIFDTKMSKMGRNQKFIFFRPKIKNSGGRGRGGSL